MDALASNQQSDPAAANAVTATADRALLARFVHERSQEAFATLARRYVDFVYATSLRRVRGDKHLAEDVTQATFILLAKRAGAILSNPSIHVPGWLHRAAGYAGANAMKINARRQHHERLAAEARTVDMSQREQRAQSTSDPSHLWNAIEPKLDAALDRLGDVDRSAIVLRYCQDCTVDETAARLGLSIDATKKRLQRGLAKLRSILRGGPTAPSVAALAAALNAGAMASTSAGAPAHVVGAIASAAANSASAASASSSIIARGALTMMFIDQLKYVGMIVTVALACVGTGAAVVARYGERLWSQRAATVVESSAVAPASGGFTFGKTVELVVNDDGLKKDECIDFDKAVTVTGPQRAFASRAEGNAWFRSSGADAHCETQEGESGFFGVDLVIVPVDNRVFDTASAEELHEELKDASRGQAPLMSADGPLPQTYQFKTREGGIGLAQIVEIKRDAQQHGTIKVKFKIVEKPAPK